jgi:hypothetical protein
MDDLLSWLQDTYHDLCNDSWEHEHGVKIDTLDNPGWSFEFDLRDTVFEDYSFQKITVVEGYEEDNNWVHCWFENGIFTGHAGGAHNLAKMILIFKEWYQQTEKIIDGEEKKE